MSNPADDVKRLIAEGLRLYGVGQPRRALGAWYEAADLDPGNPRIEEYIRYVKSQFTATPSSSPGEAEAPPGMGGLGLDEDPPVQSEPAAKSPSSRPGGPQRASWLDDARAASSASQQAEPEATPVPAGPSRQQPPLSSAADQLGWPSAPEPSAAPEAGRASRHDTAVGMPAPTLAGRPPGAGLDLVMAGKPSAAPAPAPEPERSEEDEVEALLSGARDLLELDSLTDAHEVLAKLVDLAPDHAEAQRLKGNCEKRLMRMWSNKIGKLSGVPQVKMNPDEIIWLSLDHRAGFVLSQIDGITSYEDLVALCGMPRFDLFRILAQLLGEGIVEST